MYKRWSLALILLCAVMLSLSMGGIVHAVVPHEHGHTDILPSIWQDLHAAVQHENKQVVSVALLAFVVFGIFFMPIRAYAYSRNLQRIIATCDPLRGAMLRSGIFSYRKFR